MNMIWNDSDEMAWKTTSRIKVQSIHYINHKFSHNSVFEMKWKDWDDEMDKSEEDTQSDISVKHFEQR